MRRFGNFTLVIVAIVLFFGWGAMCQVGYGTVRPYLPTPVRAMFGGDYEDSVDDYFDNIERSFAVFLNESEICSERQDQKCLTEAVQKLYDDTDYLPSEASWMGEAHGNLRDAIGVLLELNIRSETEEPTLRMANEGIRAGEDLAFAIENWFATANK